MTRHNHRGIAFLVAVVLAAIVLTGCGTTGSGSFTGGGGSSSPASISASPGTANFGSVLVGTTASQTITLANTGGSAATLTAVNASSSTFGVSGLSLPATIGAGASLPVSITVTPTSAGTISGTISFVSSAANSPAVVTVNGTATSGSVAQIAASPASINFGSITVNTSANRTLTVSNPGTATLTVTAANMTGAAFSITGTMFPISINQGASRAMTVTFNPGTVGNHSGNITFASNATNQISPVILTGAATAVPAPMLNASPTDLSYGQVPVGGSSSRTVTLSNTGNASVTISAANVTGAGFSVTGITFPRTVAVGASTTATIRFAPQSAGGANGSVSFVSNANNSPAVVTVSGSSFAPVAHFVDLSWQETSTVSGYRVYRSNQSGSGYQLITSSPVSGTTFTDASVQSGQTYFYVVTAVASGAESAFSNETTAIIPIP